MIKSQDDLGKQGRDSEVLISAIERCKQLEHENTLLKVANAELRDQLDTINTRLEKAFYDDNTSFWDALVDIRKTLKKDSTND